jgi:four helix bundle protein
MKTNFTFKDLKVWQKAVAFATDVITTIENNSSERKHFRLLEQIEACATSVSMNIAEGKGRYSKKEFVQFLFIARGSLFETVTLLNVFAEMNWIDKSRLNALEEQAKMLNSMIKSIKSNA